jgi:hypothetical protein
MATMKVKTTMVQLIKTGLTAAVLLILLLIMLKIIMVAHGGFTLLLRKTNIVTIMPMVCAADVAVNFDGEDEDDDNEAYEDYVHGNIFAAFTAFA